MPNRVMQIHRCASTVIDDVGTRWVPIALGMRRADETWIGWIEFHARDGDVRVTGRETTQSTLDALMYWATGLEATFLEGAFSRSVLVSEAGYPPADERPAA